MSKHVALNAFLAIGMTFVIITGGIDLSVGSIVGFCANGGGRLDPARNRPAVSVTRCYFNVPEIVLITLALGVFDRRSSMALLDHAVSTSLRSSQRSARSTSPAAPRSYLSDGATFPNLESAIRQFGTTGYGVPRRGRHSWISLCRSGS